MKELELELAKTKLALVETECKNQDLTHQLSLTQDRSEGSAGSTKAWFSGKSLFNSANKTLTSIRETAAASSSSGPSSMVRSMSVVPTTSSGQPGGGGGAKPNMSKSTSVDNIRD